MESKNTSPRASPLGFAISPMELQRSHATSDWSSTPHLPVVEVLTSRGRVGSPEPGSTTQILGLLETLQLCNRMNPTHAPSYEDPQEWWWQCSPLAGVAERHSLVGGPH